ncbi:SpoIID/LytB domain-containing protein [bacterium]|nr:SpoIID/LytB domain-containing protein [bacterium]
MPKRQLFLCIAILFLMAGCAVKPPPITPIESPRIRVGILQGEEPVVFRTEEVFFVKDGRDSCICRAEKGIWTAETVWTLPGRTVYRVVAGSMSSREAARSLAREIEKAGWPADIQPFGKILRFKNNLLVNNRTWRIYLEPRFEVRDSAAAFRDRLPAGWDAFIAREKLEDSRGNLRLKNAETGDSILCPLPVSLTCRSAEFTDVPVGSGFHWAHSETRLYQGAFSFTLDSDGNLTVINTLPLEEYLRGVVPSEMASGFPGEALKAQAIAARSKVLAGLSTNHIDDPYDVCATVHCQVFSGKSKNSPETDRAVRATTGRVLWSRGKIVDSIFGAVCGGHGEDVEKAWGGKAHDHLRGRFDGPDRLKRFGDLSREENARKWIDAEPTAYCNSRKGLLPAAMNYTKKYYRWQVRLTQQEIRDALTRFTGRDMGPVLRLMPLKRGVSGRIILLRITAASGDTLLSGELNIRKALSATTLWSSCFYVSPEAGPDGPPAAFNLRGAGWGHGVGMCQTGAAVMALLGKSCDKILKHYYRGVGIKKLY